MKPLLTALFILLATVSHAQQSDLQKTIQLKKGWMRIDAIMQEIYKQGSLKFSFNSQQISPSKKIQITNDRLTIGAVLSQVEQTAGVKFKVVGRHIVLLNQAKEQRANAVSQGKKRAANAIVKGVVITKDQERANRNKSNTVVAIRNQIILSEDSHKKPGKSEIAVVAIDSTLFRKRVDSVSSFSEKALPGLSKQNTLDTIPTITKPVATPLLAAANEEREKFFWISAGVNSNELSYINPSIRAGYKNWYALLSLENCPCSASYRWGVGTELWEDRNWQLQQALTTATTAAIYPAATLPEVLVKNRHYKWSALLSKVVWSKVQIQAGPVINLLHTRYFASDGEGKQQQVAPGTLLPETMDGDKVFTSTEAPYSFFNTYKSNRNANWKGWIGAELSIYYKLSFSMKNPLAGKNKRKQ